MDKKSTISDIAKKLGVSNALVSFVLNGKSKEKRISDAMTRRVIKMAKKMNYKPNELARGLRTGKSNTIGLIVADISNPFFAMFARYIEIEASKYNYKVIFSNSNEQKETFASQLDILMNGRVDGFILTPPIGSESELTDLKKQKVPFVVLDRVFKDVETHLVTINNYQSGYDAAVSLIKNNCKRIAILNTNNQLFTMRQRVKGFKDALAAKNVEADNSLIKHLKFSHEKKMIMTAIKSILANGADGILFTTSKLGVIGVECLRELNVRIPQDVSVISYDDTEAYKVSYTPITAVIQPIEQMSKEAVRILIKMIEGKYGPGEFENIMLDVNFIYRASCL